MSYAISVDAVRCRVLDMNLVGQRMEMWCWAACTQMVVGYMRLNLGETGGAAEIEPSQGEQANRAARLYGWESYKKGIDCTREPKTAEEYEACNVGGWPYFYEFDEGAQSTMMSSHRFALEELGIPLRADGWPRRVERVLASEELDELARHPEVAQALYDAEDCALSWPALTALLDDGSPVVFSWRTPQGKRNAGHLMLAVGYAATPPDGRWVVAFNPLPPATSASKNPTAASGGDLYLISYDHYVTGDLGRHWRDIWIPRPVAGQPLPPRYAIDDLRVGTELARSTMTATEDLSVSEKGAGSGRASAGGGSILRLSADDVREVRGLAEEGLEAVKAVASQAPALAYGLQMGGALIRDVLRVIICEPLGLEIEPADPDRPQVDPEHLKLAEDHLPVHEVGLEKLAAWDGRDLPGLLGAPRGVIWEVVRSDFETYDFFTTITLRRFDDGWRVVTLGRASASASLGLAQIFDTLEAALSGDRELTLEGIVEHLSELGLLGVLLRLVVEQVLPAIGNLPTEGTEMEASGRELERIFKAETLDKAALLRLARKLDKARGVQYSRREVPKPEYIVDVLELYQQFVAYSDDELVPVYDAEFYPPTRVVPRGDRASVVERLRKIAQEVV